MSTSVTQLGGEREGQKKQAVSIAHQNSHSPGITPLFWIKSKHPQGDFSTDGRLPPPRLKNDGSFLTFPGPSAQEREGENKIPRFCPHIRRICRLYVCYVLIFPGNTFSKGVLLSHNSSFFAAEDKFRTANGKTFSEELQQCQRRKLY